MKKGERISRFAYPLLVFMSMVFLGLAYFNLKTGRTPEGMVVLAGSVMMMVMAVGAHVCRRVENATERLLTKALTASEKKQ